MTITTKFGFIKALLLSFVLFIKLSAYGANIEQVEVESRYLTNPVKVTVISPSSGSATDGQLIPTLYLLNGFDGDHNSWLQMVPNLSSLSDQYGIRVICPDGKNSWYWDSSKQKNMNYESFFIKELIPHLTEIYGLPSEREWTAITGFSMGGHGAFWLATQYPDKFGAVGSISGGLDLRAFKTNWNLQELLGSYKENEKLWYDSTIASQYPKLKQHEFAILFDCGVDDFFYPANLQFHQLLQEHKIAHDFITRPGAHTHVYAANSLDYQLLFFHKFFTKRVRN